MKRIMNGSWAGKLEYNSCFLKNAKDLFDYALSLKKSYSEWDTRLPNPEITASVTEKEWVEKINTLFLDTVTFFFFHEYAHLVNGHLNVFKEIKNKKSDKLSTDEMYELIQAEQEADNFAREVMIGDDDPDFFQLRVTIGILMSHISSLFLINNPIHVSQKTHPDLDDRVFNCIRAFNSSEQKSDFYVKHLAIMALSVFFNNNGYDIPNSEFETIGDCIKKYEEIFDRIKSP